MQGDEDQAAPYKYSEQGEDGLDGLRRGGVLGQP